MLNFNTANNVSYCGYPYLRRRPVFKQFLLRLCRRIREKRNKVQKPPRRFRTCMHICLKNEILIRHVSDGTAAESTTNIHVSIYLM